MSNHDKNTGQYKCTRESMANRFHNRAPGTVLLISRPLVLHPSISMAKPTLWPPLITLAQSTLKDILNVTFSSIFCCRLMPSCRSVLNLQRNIDLSSILHLAAAPTVHSWKSPFLARMPFNAASHSGFT